MASAVTNCGPTSSPMRSSVKAGRRPSYKWPRNWITQPSRNSPRPQASQVTTPMLALVPLLILKLGFGSEPRIIAVALASGPMVMINSATGFRRVDLAKIALARSFGASTFQIFTKIRIPMAMPMIIVGLMVGSIFGLLTTVGAEMVGGAEGLGNRLTYYSSLIRMPQFFAIILILAIIGTLLPEAETAAGLARAAVRPA